MGPSQILIVDDDPWILKMVTTVLGKRGYRIHTAADGQEAYLKAIEIRPDLIVTDIMMPKMDGWTLVRSLRTRSDLALTPVIFLSALGSDEDRIQGFRLGADDYLPKPFRFEELDLRVQNALRKRRPVAESGAVPRMTVPTPMAAPLSGHMPGQAPGPMSMGMPMHSTQSIPGMGPGMQPHMQPPPNMQAPIPMHQPSSGSGPAPMAPAPHAAPPGGIQGTLEQLGLSSLLVMVEMERKSGILILRKGPQTGRIFIKQGKVIAARLDVDNKKGPDAVYMLLTWVEGRFDFSALDIDMEDEMKGMSTQFLLMEGARLIDEAAAAKK